MHYIGALLLIALAVKLKAVLSAIIWIARDGEEHAVELRNERKIRDITEEDFFASFRSHSGAFWPFGVKDYKLRSLIRQLQHPPEPPSSAILFSIRWCIASALNLLRLMLFEYRFLSFVSVVFIVVAAVAYRFPESLRIHVTDSIRHMAFAIALGTILMNLAMTVEFVFGHLFLTDYALYFHMLSPPKTVLAGRSQLVVELQVFVMLALVVFATGLAAVFGVYLLFGGFGGGVLEQYTSPHLSDLPTIAWFCAYYTLTTLTTTGFGDIVPKNGFGVAIGVGLQVEAFAIIVFGLAVFWYVRSKTRTVT